MAVSSFYYFAAYTPGKRILYVFTDKYGIQTAFPGIVTCAIPNPHGALMPLNSIRYGVKGVSGKETQQGYPDSDREAQQSKCCALPFGDSPKSS